MKTIAIKTLIVFTLSGCLLLCGCNTMEGFGKDLEKVGGKIQESADK